MIGGVGVEVGVLRDCWGEWGWRWRWVDTALEHEISITLRIGRNVKR